MLVPKEIIYDFSAETELMNTANCSIMQHAEGYILNVSMTNKAQPDRQLTLNRKLLLDNTFKVLSDEILEQEADARRIAGVSDIRLREEEDGVMFHGHALHPNGLMGIVTGKYQSPLELEFIRPKEFTQAATDWVYVPFSDGYHIIESWNPLTIGHVVDGEFHIKYQLETPSLAGARGATNACLYNDEMYFLVHNGNGEHKFVVFSAKMDELKRQTEWFTFENDSDKALGLVVTKEKILVSYTNARVAVLKMPQIYQNKK